MHIPAVKGTRDLYPEAFAPLRHIFDTWRRVSERHGFAEYEGPTLEMLDLYREKSGEELVGQVYRLTDSGGRELAMRPEMTPTLARMVAARISSLPKPLKWFSIPRLYRGENVQRGRLREFYQWNVDVIGAADVVADAECILVGVEALRELGLTAADFAVHISNRRLMSALLAAAGIADEAHAAAFALIDKSGKAGGGAIAESWDAAFGGQIRYARLHELLKAPALDDLRAALPGAGGAAGRLEEALAETEGLITVLRDFGIIDFCNIDLSVVRGLAYYTGPVFEFYDRGQQERAICGGGRYDDLLGRLGKSKEPAVGFGMGDVVLAIMLEERNLLRAGRRGREVLVADAVGGLRRQVHRVVGALRRAGLSTEFGYAQQPLGKQLRLAAKLGVAAVVILGSETTERGVVQVKDMVGEASREVPLSGLLADPRTVLAIRA